MDPNLALAGAATGFLIGLTGVGGGALMTPLLLLVFGIAPMSAVGTDLWFAAITKTFVTRMHYRRDLIDWAVARLLWTGSLTATVVTLAAIKLFPVSDGFVAALRMAIAIMVIATALGLIFQGPMHALGRRFRLGDAVWFKTWQGPLTIAAGALLGFLVTLTSIGAGALGVVFLAYLYPLRLTPPRLIATDIVHAIPLAMFAGLGHLLIGNVNFGLLGNLLIGSIPAALIGGLFSTRLPHLFLRGVLAIILLSIGAKLLLSHLH